MTDAVDRRRFLGVAAATGISAARMASAKGSGFAPGETIVVGVMGMGGRGKDHARGFAALPGVEVAYVCDVDHRRAGEAAKVVEQAGGKAPRSVTDFRR